MAVVACTPAVAAPCPNERTPAPEATTAQLEDSFVCLVNRERRRHDLRPLNVATRLEQSALGHARDMAAGRYFAHASIDGRTFVDRIRAAGYLEGREDERWSLGETLAWGSASAADPARLFQALLDSPPHRRVILEDGYREIGVGVVHGTPEGEDTGAIAVLNYGSLTSPAALRQAPTQELAGQAGDRPRVKGKRKANGKPKPAKASSTGDAWRIRISAAWFWYRPPA